MTTNTTKSIKSKTPTAKELDAQVKKAAKELKENKKVDVLIPKHLKPVLGNVVPVGLNGAVVHIPVGKKVPVPESMATILNRSLEQIHF